MLESVQHVLARRLWPLAPEVRPAKHHHRPTGGRVQPVAHQVLHNLAPLFGLGGLVFQRGRWLVPLRRAHVGPRVVGCPWRIDPNTRCRVGHIPAVRLDTGANGGHHVHLATQQVQDFSELRRCLVARLLVRGQVRHQQLRLGLAPGQLQPGLGCSKVQSVHLGLELGQLVARDLLALAVRVAPDHHAVPGDPSPVGQADRVRPARPAATRQLIAQQPVQRLGALLPLDHTDHRALGDGPTRQVQRPRRIPGLPVPARRARRHRVVVVAAPGERQRFLAPVAGGEAAHVAIQLAIALVSPVQCRPAAV